jgi:hypothetical protein
MCMYIYIYMYMYIYVYMYLYIWYIYIYTYIRIDCVRSKTLSKRDQTMSRHGNWRHLKIWGMDSALCTWPIRRVVLISSSFYTKQFPIGLNLRRTMSSLTSMLLNCYCWCFCWCELQRHALVQDSCANDDRAGLPLEPCSAKTLLYSATSSGSKSWSFAMFKTILNI